MLCKKEEEKNVWMYFTLQAWCKNFFFIDYVYFMREICQSILFVFLWSYFEQKVIQYAAYACKCREAKSNMN